MRSWLRTRLASGSDRGDVVATSIVFSMVLLLTLLVIQAGVYLQARSAAAYAAEAGVDAARAQSGSLPAGIAAATQFAVTSGGALQTPVATGNRSGNEAQITMSGTAPSLIPFFDVTVSVTRTGPVERVIMPGQGY